MFKDIKKRYYSKNTNKGLGQWEISCWGKIVPLIVCKYLRINYQINLTVLILTHFVRNQEEMGEWMKNLSTPQIMINKITLQYAKTEKINTN